MKTVYIQDELFIQSESTDACILQKCANRLSSPILVLFLLNFSRELGTVEIEGCNRCRLYQIITGARCDEISGSIIFELCYFWWIWTYHANDNERVIIQIRHISVKDIFLLVNNRLALHRISPDVKLGKWILLISLIFRFHDDLNKLGPLLEVSAGFSKSNMASKFCKTDTCSHFIKKNCQANFLHRNLFHCGCQVSVH